MGGFLMNGGMEVIEYDDGSYDEVTYIVKSIYSYDHNGTLKEKLYYRGTLEPKRYKFVVSKDNTTIEEVYVV